MNPCQRPALSLLALLAGLCLLQAPAPAGADGGEDLLLLWAANEEPDLRGYRIYESDDLGNLGALVQVILEEEIPPEHSDQGLASAEFADVPPGDHCWSVTAFDLNQNESDPSAPACITIGTPPTAVHMADHYEEPFYGSYPGVPESHDQDVVYTFDGIPGELLLCYRLWDVDAPEEVEIVLNGYSLGFAAMTGRYGASPLVTTRIPPEYLFPGGLNTLAFRWASSGPGDMWAVGTVEITELIPLPASGFYGNLADVPGGDTSHPRMAGFMFEGSPGHALLFYRVYDMDFVGELQIFLNGQWLGRVNAVADNGYSGPTPLFLPDEMVLDEGVNTLVFNNVLNPPYPMVWGVGSVTHP